MQSRLPPFSLNLPGKTYLLWEQLEAPLTDETLRKRKDGKRQLVAEVKEEGEVVVVVVGVVGVGEEEEERARPKRFVRNHTWFGTSTKECQCVGFFHSVPMS